MTKEKKRLEYLRQEIRAERISYGEIAELQNLAKDIPEDDAELLEWAGVREVLEECGHLITKAVYKNAKLTGYKCLKCGKFRNTLEIFPHLKKK